MNKTPKERYDQYLGLESIKDEGTTVVKLPEDTEIYRSNYSGDKEFVGYARELMNSTPPEPHTERER